MARHELSRRRAAPPALMLVSMSFVAVACGTAAGDSRPVSQTQPAPASTTSPASVTTAVAPVVAPPTTTAATTTASPVSTTTTTPPTTAAPARITVLATGDTLVHEEVARRAAANGRATGAAYDFRPMFASVEPIVSSADLAICHLESMVVPAGQDFSYFPAFGVPAPITSGLASAGYDRCSLASNHTLDRGEPGVAATLAALDAAGLGHVGAARSAAEAKPAVTTVAGVGVAHLSYTFGVTGEARLRAKPWLANVIDPARIVADARAARSAGATIVLVSLHWGNEYSNVVSGYQRRVAQQITASNEVDLIIGHHTHVPMPVEQVNGTWVLFGLGNHLSNQRGGLRPASTQDGFMATVTFTPGPDGRWVADAPVVHPTYVDRRTYTIVPVATALADPATDPVLVPQLRASYERSRAVAGGLIAPVG